MKSMSLITKFTLLALILGLTACGGSPAKKSQMQSTLFAYGKAVRWNEFEQAARFLAPDYLKDNPVTSLQAERFRQIRVTHYREYNLAVGADGQTAQQRVEISFINIHNKGERKIVDEQLWKFNPETSQWRLWSGLPDITRKPRR